MFSERRLVLTLHLHCTVAVSSPAELVFETIGAGALLPAPNLWLQAHYCLPRHIIAPFDLYRRTLSMREQVFSSPHFP
jgi:hypothetical protein